MNGIFIQIVLTCVSKFPSRFAGTAAAFGLMTFSSVANASETAFIFNTFSFIIWGALVMWMCAGFTMLEAGSVRSPCFTVPLRTNERCWQAMSMHWIRFLNPIIRRSPSGYSRWISSRRLRQSYPGHWRNELSSGRFSFSRYFSQRSSIPS